MTLPSGANPKRSKILWELGLGIASDKSIPYGGDRDMCISVGSGAGQSFRGALRIATGSAEMAYAVARGEIDLAFINPSAMLTQAYRGVGLFDTPLPLRIVASYPSLDRFALLIRESTGMRSLADIKRDRYPLQLSLREDPTHSTRILIDQLLGFYGFSLAHIEAWGGRVHKAGPPGDKRRLDGLREGWLEAVFDEGYRNWFGLALETGLKPIELEPEAFAHLEALGWRRAIVKAGRFPGLAHDHVCVDFSGWPLYGRADLADEIVEKVCASFVARESEMPWEEEAYQGVAQIFTQTDSTPMDVPIHSAALRWLDRNKQNIK